MFSHGKAKQLGIKAHFGGIYTQSYIWHKSEPEHFLFEIDQHDSVWSFSVSLLAEIQSQHQ